MGRLRSLDDPQTSGRFRPAAKKQQVGERSVSKKVSGHQNPMKVVMAGSAQHLMLLTGDLLLKVGAASCHLLAQTPLPAARQHYPCCKDVPVSFPQVVAALKMCGSTHSGISR